MEKRNNIIKIILSAATVFVTIAVAGTAAAYAPASAIEREVTAASKKVILTTCVDTLASTAEVSTIEATTQETQATTVEEISTTAAITEEVTEPVEDNSIEEYEYEEVEEDSCEETFINYSSGDYSPSDLEFSGRLYWGGWSWTWYSERILPGEGLSIPGRYTDENGFVCDENGYICLASGSLSKGTVVETPFGRSGKVYDCGCAADTLDIYVNW
jgi:hypothetical protein|nr:MAG TPA: hypothetical protein [Caudoviricetes sp.]